MSEVQTEDKERTFADYLAILKRAARIVLRNADELSEEEKRDKRIATIALGLSRILPEEEDQEGLLTESDRRDIENLTYWILRWNLSKRDLAKIVLQGVLVEGRCGCPTCSARRHTRRGRRQK